jgi:hypothetical protein
VTHQIRSTKTYVWNTSSTVSIRLFLWPVVLCLFAMLPASAQLISAPEPQTGGISGTVMDITEAIVPGASVALEGTDSAERLIAVANESGFFAIGGVRPAVPYHLTVSAQGFHQWTSPTILLNPDQYVSMTEIKLQSEKEQATITVYGNTEQLATEQVQMAEQQRILGFIPNFYVVYDRNPVPLTTKLKFKLALRASYDPVTILGVAAMAGINQAADHPNYVQGAKGYGQRLGSGAADGFTDIMIGGAILPSLLHQDPRYFYQGTGTKKSRFLHAISSPILCKGDNGKLQPNYSSVGGDLSSGALSMLYYPASNSGAGLVFQNALIVTGGRMANSLIQEFVLRRFTSNAGR